MENKENNTNKVTETLVKELESMSKEELHEFFLFFYKLNHQHGNMLSVDQFEEFLEAFDSNPFKVNEEKAFKKTIIDPLSRRCFPASDITHVFNAINQQNTRKRCRRKATGCANYISGRKQ